MRLLTSAGIVLDEEDATYPHGFEIAVKGFQGDVSKTPVQVFVEVYKGKLWVRVWDGSSEDAIHNIEIPRVQVEVQS